MEMIAFLFKQLEMRMISTGIVVIVVFRKKGRKEGVMFYF